MQPKNQTVDVPVFRSSELFNWWYFRHRLDSVFRVKSSNIGLVFFNICASSPNSPEMDVAWTDVLDWIWGNRRRCFPVVDFRMLFFKNFCQNSFENIVVHILDYLLLFFCFATFPTPFLPSNPNLVIAIPQTHRRMISDPFNIVSHFRFDIFQNFIWRRIECTGKHEIMPNKDSSFIHGRIKLVFFKLTSSPKTDHIEPSKKRILGNFIVGRFVGPCEWHFWGNVVASSHVDIIAIEVEFKGSAVELFALLNNLYSSYSCWHRLRQYFSCIFFEG